MASYPRSAQASATIEATAAIVFDYLDDQANLSAHMSSPSGMMLGSAMDIYMEPDHTRRVGSRFGFTGSVLGVPLNVDEVVTGRVPPFSKTWETTKEPRLWVIGRYRMGFELTPQRERTTLRVYISYDLPSAGVARLLGRLFGAVYAKWCTGQMVSDASAHFDRQAGRRPIVPSWKDQTNLRGKP